MASIFKRKGKSNRHGYYYLSWHDHRGKRHTKCAKTTDKATAERIAAKLEADAALRREGVIDAALDAIGKESKRTIESHLADYESKMRAANRSDQYIRETAKYIRDITEVGQFEDAGEINADAVTKFANILKDKGKSARTIQAHLTAIKGFTRWLSSHHKLPRDPLASVKKPDPKTDRRRQRRTLLPDEWGPLRAATLMAGDRFGMSGPERVLLYDIAIQTGLRSGELRSLVRGQLFLDSPQPCVTCKASATKNRKAARQYVRAELAEDLKKHAATKITNAPVFAMPRETDVAKMLRSDLADARRAWLKQAKHDSQERLKREQSDFLLDVNHEGKRLDFHSLRHSCGAWLALAGVHPKVVQIVMRHSSITLTMDTYGHLFPGQKADAVVQMGGLLPSTSEPMQATGTNDAVASFELPVDYSSAQRQAQRAGRESVREGRDPVRTEKDSAAQEESPKPLQIADLGDGVRADASENQSAPSWTRTKNLLIKSQLLCQLS